MKNTINYYYNVNINNLIKTNINFKKERLASLFETPTLIPVIRDTKL